MFRFAFLALALIGLGSLLFGGVGATGAGLLLVAPLLIAGKILLILLFLGAIGGFFFRGYDSRRYGSWTRRRPTANGQEAPRPSREEQFEEWHRLAHARDEVDSWVPDIEQLRDNEQREDGPNS